MPELKKKYLHFITKPYSINIIRPLLYEIRKSKRGESLVFITKKVEQYIDSDLPYTMSIEEVISFNPDVVFVPGNVLHDKIPGLKVQIFHGLCEEKGGHYKITGFFDLYCTSGPLITNRFKELAKKKRHFHVVETGWPKIDLLLKPFDREKICKSLNIDPAKRIILYAPTFSPKFKSSEKILPILEDLPKDDELWIVKFHDLMKAKDIERFSKLQSDSLLLYSNPDNIPLLQIADVLISDTSSVVYEFMLLDKPVITIDSKVRLKKGINITKAGQLRPAVDRSLANPEEYCLGRKRVLNQIHPYRDTQNSRRVLDAVDEVLNSKVMKDLKEKPLNLYRKYNVRRKFGHWI